MTDDLSGHQPGQTVVAFRPFMRKAAAIGLSNDEVMEIEYYFSQNPQSGSVIKGSSGIRKTRFAFADKGKRGGLRIFSLFIDDDAPVFLLALLSKNDRDDLSADELSGLAVLASMLKKTR